MAVDREAGVENAGAAADPPGWPRRVWREMRERPAAYIVMAAFTAAGPFVVSFLFPEASLGVGIVGGFALGVYAALCALPGQFL